MKIHPIILSLSLLTTYGFNAMELGETSLSEKRGENAVVEGRLKRLLTILGLEEEDLNKEDKLLDFKKMVKNMALNLLKVPRSSEAEAKIESHFQSASNSEIELIKNFLDALNPKNAEKFGGIFEQCSGEPE